jgi:soluble lytic murein transglycosylase
MRFFLSVFLVCFSVVSPAMAVSPSTSFIRAIDEENWSQAMADAGRDGTLKSYAQWRMLQDFDTDADFAALSAFIEKHPDWPRLNRLRIRAEKALFQSGGESSNAERWLNRYEPISGYGMLALARFSPDHQRIRDGWIQGDFEYADQLIILNEFRASLDAATHAKRAERLLSQRKASAAEPLLDVLNADTAKLVRARIALQRKERNVNAKIDAIPSKYRDDNGLLADRTDWRHKKGLISGARELLLQMDDDSPYADTLWRIRKAYARDAIEAGHYNSAQALLESAGNTLTGSAKADALWMHGWLQFVFKDNPRRAYEIFNTLHHSVGYPVSLARGAYWAARAADKNGNKDIARSWYDRAAKHPTTFYGQIAIAHLQPNAPLALPAAPAADHAAKKRFANHALWRLSVAFHKAKQSAFVAPLVYHLAQSSGEFSALMALAKSEKMVHAQVIIAKLAMRKHIVLPDGWPIVMPPADVALAPELALAIARQESEFNPIAVSHANARGLMQLLPSTARKTAKKLELPYSLERLFDPVYNMRLGSKYLGDLINGFDGNYILAIAGYNAGPGRSRQWIERFGWPGKDVDETLKFMELIPFSETRNYVQRVLENAQMYKARMQPNAPLGIVRDLGR